MLYDMKFWATQIAMMVRGAKEWPPAKGTWERSVLNSAEAWWCEEVAGERGWPKEIGYGKTRARAAALWEKTMAKLERKCDAPPN